MSDVTLTTSIFYYHFMTLTLNTIIFVEWRVMGNHLYLDYILKESVYFFLPVVQQLCISLKLQSNYKNNTSCKKWKAHKEIWQRTGNQIRCIWDGNVQLLGGFFCKFSLCLDPSGWQGAHLIIKAKKIMLSSCFILIHLSSLQCLRNQEWFQESSELVTDVV